MTLPRKAARVLQLRFERVRRRITCDLYIAGERHSAIVTDLSASGLYVRTPEAPESGASVRLVLHEEGGEIEIDAEVVREDRLRCGHTPGTPSGVGLKIKSAPQRYFQLLAKLSE